MNDRPLLLIDVDGVLNPFSAREVPEGYTDHKIIPAGWIDKPLTVRLNPDHGPMLLDFAERTGFELAWATTWESDANTLIAPHIGLPELPVIGFNHFYKSNWKFGAVQEYAKDRPLAWLDDDFLIFSREHREFLRSRRVPTHTHVVMPSVGLLRTDLDQIEQWACEAKLIPALEDSEDVSDPHGTPVHAD